VDKQKRHAGIVLLIAAGLAIVLIQNHWKTDTAKITEAKPDAQMQGMAELKPVSVAEFFGQVFKEIKPPEWIGRQLMQELEKVKTDSLNAVLRWADETNNLALDAYIRAQIALKTMDETAITEAARNCIGVGDRLSENTIVAGYLFQTGKKLIDLGLAKNNKNVPLRNALITYLSIYENAPMKFLGVLRETLAMDSNNVETHFIHLGLLKKSGQWKKALDKCRKLISLQPQNPDWLYEMSHLYGTQGDSVNAKTYLELAKKVRKTQQPQ
jgi:tetratricopeptide (TPR) repeat protein